MSISGKIARALEGAPDAPAWLRGGLAALTPLGWIYGAAMSLRWSLYETGGLATRAVSCPVISVGNLTLGGTGKSPTVACLVDRLLESGRRPGVVSRGYGGSLTEVSVVSDGAGQIMSSPPASDEAVMLARRFPSVPVITGRDRPEAACRAADEFNAEVIVVDDGFQHMALERDVDLVLLRGDRPFGNGRVFPAGALREPASALRRSHIILLTGDVRSEMKDMVERVASQAEVFSGSLRARGLLDANGQEAGTLEDLKRAAVIAVSGIGQPESFLQMLSGLGVRVLAHHAYPDHAVYPPHVVTRLEDSLKETGADFLLTTEKDMVKISGARNDWRTLRVEMEIQEGDDLTSLIINRIEESTG